MLFRLLPLPNHLQELLEAIVVGLPFQFLQGAADDVRSELGAPEEAEDYLKWLWIPVDEEVAFLILYGRGTPWGSIQ